MFSPQYPMYGSNQQSYANGMQPDVPMPMQGLGSYMQSSMGQAPSYEMNKPQYASGGRVSLSQMANRLRQHGEGGDKILAHINPEEAQFLQQHFGGDINPKTGLPQYGFFKKLRKNKLAKVLLNVLPAVAGFMVAGPAGAAAAGALGGSLSHKNPLKGGLLGGAIGGLGGYGAQALGFGPGAAAASGRAGAFSTLQGVGKGASAAGAGGSGLFGGGGGGLSGLLGGGMLSNALLGTAVLGTLAGKQKIPKEPSMQDVVGQNAEMMAANADMPGVRAHNEKEITASPLNRVRRNFDQDVFAPSNLGQENQYFQNVNPQSVYMAHGGHLNGHTDGQADRIHAMLSDGEFVIPADVTSDLGDGNNNAGAKKLYGLIDQVRRQKRSKPKGLPPKAKSLSAYMKQRGTR